MKGRMQNEPPTTRRSRSSGARNPSRGSSSVVISDGVGSGGVAGVLVVASDARAVGGDVLVFDGCPRHAVGGGSNGVVSASWRCSGCCNTCNIP